MTGKSTNRASRYRTSTEMVLPGTMGQGERSLTPRSIPDVGGTFLHTVEENDRLDHAGYRYYKQPKKWWRICDANPGFPRPLDLFGGGAVAHKRFAVRDTDCTAVDWALVVKALRDDPGVADAWIETDAELTDDTVIEDGASVAIVAEEVSFTVCADYFTGLIDDARIVAICSGSGVRLEAPLTIARTGKKIVVPPDGTD